MKLVVFGATGTVGRHVAAQAVEAGHDVLAVSRGGAPVGGARGFAADIFDPEAVLRAVEGADAVICVIGAGRAGGVRSLGAANIVAAMERAGVRRLICQSTLGAGDSVGNLNFWWRRVMFGLLLKPAFEDHQKQEAIVRGSRLDWTIVRPAAFTDDPRTGEYRHGFPASGAEKLKLKIGRADVADFLLRQVASKDYLLRTPGLSY